MNGATFIWIDADRAIDILNPDPSIIDIRFIAATLARIARYNGRTPLPYSVAQHSIMVANLLPGPLRRHGLLHDAHEAILGDITAPMKSVLRQLTGIDAMARLEQEWDQAIHQALCLPWPLSAHDQALIKAADQCALATEMRDLMGIPPHRLPFTPAPNPIQAWPWPKSEERFLTTWQRLTEITAVLAAAE
jgi:hypothetical protein